jgi:hypothetical protein
MPQVPNTCYAKARPRVFSKMKTEAARLRKLARLFREQAETAAQPAERERLLEQARRYDTLAAEAEALDRVKTTKGEPP